MNLAGTFIPSKETTFYMKVSLGCGLLFTTLVSIVLCFLAVLTIGQDLENTR
jgi:hypothetical protein